ncbi:shikimate kinase [Bacteroidia bacterium]|nr:shikimate kinase [Bacteroidia bacterium]
MGSGKTTIGKPLADALHWQFVDLDTFIENRYRMNVSEIFAKYGEAGFREIERRMLQETAQFEEVVISTGGGTACFFDNMEIMKNAGKTVYLKVSVDELARRLDMGKTKRPLLKEISPEDLKTYIAENLEKRENYYRQAGQIIDAENLQTEQDISILIKNILV